MCSYRTAQVCLNGHLITDAVDKYPELSQSHCSHCGASTITHCPSCNAPIHGDYDCGVDVIGGLSSVDSYCYNCGHPYPWTESAIQSARQILLEEESLSEQTRNNVIESLPDIVAETPRTNLAAVRIKKVLSSAGNLTADAIRQFVIDFGCELAKELLNL